MHPYFILFTFMLVALTSLTLGVLRVTRYFMIQRENRLFLFAASNVFEALAFGMGALLSAPHPSYNFLFLFPFARAAWGLFSIVFFVAVVIEWRAAKRSIEGRT